MARLRVKALLSLLVAIVAVAGQDQSEAPPLIDPFFDGDQSHFVKLEPTETLTLHCTVRGSEPDEITWFKNDEEIGQNGEDLLISQPQPETDSGFYYCVAKNKMGVAKSEVILVAPEPLPVGKLLVAENVAKIMPLKRCLSLSPSDKRVRHPAEVLHEAEDRDSSPQLESHLHVYGPRIATSYHRLDQEW